MSHKRYCPICRIPLTPVHADRLTLDRCSRCRGVFFDPGELNATLHTLLDADPTIPYDEFHHGGLRAIEIAEGEPARCPHCGETMRFLNYGYDSNIFIDRCDHCAGIWVDQEHLQPIATYLKSNPHYESIVGIAKVPNREATLNREFSKGFVRNPWYANSVDLALWIEGLDHSRPIRSTATVLIIALGFAALFVELLAYMLDFNFLTLGFQPSAFLAGEMPPQIAAHMFIHLNPIQFLGAMAFLYLFGRHVEDHIDSALFIGLYIVGGMAASAVSLLLDPTSEVTYIGASRAVSCVMGAYFYFNGFAPPAVTAFRRQWRPNPYLLLALWEGAHIISTALLTTNPVTYAKIYVIHIAAYAIGYLLAHIHDRYILPPPGSPENAYPHGPL